MSYEVFPGASFESTVECVGLSTKSESVEPELYRFPAVDPKRLRARVEATFGG